MPIRGKPRVSRWRLLVGMLARICFGTDERATDTSSAATGIFDLMTRLNAPVALKDIGMKYGDLESATSLVMETPYYYPRPTTGEGIAQLLDGAFFGRRPAMYRGPACARARPASGWCRVRGAALPPAARPLSKSQMWDGL